MRYLWSRLSLIDHLRPNQVNFYKWTRLALVCFYSLPITLQSIRASLKPQTPTRPPHHHYHLQSTDKFAPKELWTKTERTIVFMYSIFLIEIIENKSSLSSWLVQKPLQKTGIEIDSLPRGNERTFSANIFVISDWWPSFSCCHLMIEHHIIIILYNIVVVIL